MSETALVTAIERELPNIKSGSLVVFGDIFGGRVDNIHRVVGAVENEDGSTTAQFDQGETLTVWDPAGVDVSADHFTVLRASRVRWEWFYYGREHLPENRYFVEHRNDGTHVDTTTNVNWYTPTFAPSPDRPAVELVGLESVRDA